jgi:transcriptional regulator with XRE-family HTH domain
LTHGWTGKELAAATGYSKSTISGYLNGDLPLDREKLEALAAAMRIGPVKVEKAVQAARLVQPETPAPVSPVDPTEEEWRILDGAVAFGLGEIADLLRAKGLREVREEHVRRDREQAEAQLRSPLVAAVKSFIRLIRRALVSELVEPSVQGPEHPPRDVQRAVWGLWSAPSPWRAWSSSSCGRFARTTRRRPRRRPTWRGSKTCWPG